MRQASKSSSMRLWAQKSWRRGSRFTASKCNFASSFCSSKHGRSMHRGQVTMSRSDRGLRRRVGGALIQRRSTLPVDTQSFALSSPPLMHCVFSDVIIACVSHLLFLTWSFLSLSEAPPVEWLDSHLVRGSAGQGVVIAGSKAEFTGPSWACRPRVTPGRRGGCTRCSDPALAS